MSFLNHTERQIYMYVISKWFISSASQASEIKQILLRSCKELLKLTNAVWNFTSCPFQQRKLSVQHLRHQEIKTPGYNLSPFSLARLTSLSCDLLLLLTSFINSLKHMTASCFQSSRKFSRQGISKHAVVYRSEALCCQTPALASTFVLCEFGCVCSLLCPHCCFVRFQEKACEELFSIRENPVAYWPCCRKIISKGDLRIYNCHSWLTRKSGLKLHLPTNCLKLSFQAQHPWSFC